MVTFPFRKSGYLILIGPNNFYTLTYYADYDEKLAILDLCFDIGMTFKEVGSDQVLPEPNEAIDN